MKVTLIMDYSHNVKKIIKNIYFSRDHDTCSRELKLHNKCVVWQHWIQAYHWDHKHYTVRIHQKLTDEHIFFTKALKLRDHLSEEMLDRNMLHQMKPHQETLQGGTNLNGTIDFGCLVVLGLTALRDSILVYIGPSPREREKEKRNDRREKKCPNNPHPHLLQAQ